MKKNKKLIPEGYYCYTYKDGKEIRCPYWSSRKDKPYQLNGYCSYLEKGDWEMSKEMGEGEFFTNCKTGEKTPIPEGFPLSLLWDMCKMCGINEGDEQ